MRRAGALLGLAALAACAEMQRPPPPEPWPILSEGQVVAPLPAILAAAQRDHEGGGVHLRGRPAAAALAAARIEWLGQEAAPGGRLADLPPGLGFALLGAVRETRQSLGVPPEAPPQGVMAALVGAARDLEAGNAAAARARLAPPLFPDSPPDALARLNEPGPRPEAALALGALAEELDRRARRPTELAPAMDPLR